jgi:threonine-phosphate decarboxylase
LRDTPQEKHPLKGKPHEKKPHEKKPLGGGNPWLYQFFRKFMLSPKHGGNVLLAANQLGIPVDQIMDFSANINPLGQPENLQQYLTEALALTIHYPEIYAETLTAAIANFTLLPTNFIFPGSGTSPLMYQLTRIIKAKRAVVIVPAFSEYFAALEQVNCPIFTVSCLQDQGFTYDPETVTKIVDFKPQLVFLANPANPTGVLADYAVLQDILQAGEKKSFFTVIDEAFIDFCTPKQSVEELTPNFPHLIVLKSLTKLFAIPGLRLGYLVTSHPDLQKELTRTTEPWAINSLAQAAGPFLLKENQYLKRVPLTTTLLRDELVKALEPYFELVKSDANFLMGRPKKNKQVKLISYLYKKGILVRNLNNFREMPAGYIRIAVRPKAEIRILEKAVAEFYEQT